MPSTWLVSWLVLFVILMVIELFTTKLFTIWMGLASLVSAVMAACKLPVWSQWIAFIVISFLLFAFVRPKAKRKYDAGHRKDSIGELIGSRGMVISDIDNLHGVGQVRVGGKAWRAQSRERGFVIPEGTIINVVAVNGEKLVVCLDDSMKDNLRLERSDATLAPDFNEDFGEDDF